MRLAALALLLSVDFAWADGATADDKARIETCLSQNEFDPSACFFAASDPCTEVEEQRAANPLQAQQWCDHRENDVWQSLIEQSLTILRRELSKDAINALERQHNHWLAGKKLHCTFPYEFLKGTWVSSGAARCHLKYVQERAARLLVYMRYANHDMFVGQTVEAE
ncbi:MAG: lysozyme inhibitor LprI family protein [Pseudomonadota bacterium]